MKNKYPTIQDVYLKVLTEGGHTQKANVVNQLTQLKRNAEHLLEQVNADLEYPAWWVNKLVKANDYLDTAHDYLNNKVDQGQGPIPKDESVEESTKAYGDSLRKIANDRKLKSISKKDKETLLKIADMMAKANEEVVTEANKQISVGWDMGDPKRGGLADDWQDEYGIVMSKWDKRKAEITIGGDEKELMKWLTSDYGMDKKEAQTLIRKGKRIR